MEHSEMKEQIKDLLYLKRNIDNIIDNLITEDVMRGKPVDVERFTESVNYHIEEDFGRFQKKAGK